MKTNSRLVVVLLLMQFTALPDLRAQYLENFSIIHPDPTTADLVSITVHGTITWANVHLVDSSIVSMETGLDIRLIAITESEVSIPILLPYSRTFYVRVFAPGRYSALANFYLNGRICYSVDTAFVVCEPSVVEQSGWDFDNLRNVSLHHNHPNPFNPSTTILYDLPQPSQVEIAVFDLLGKRVRTFVQEREQAGQHRLLWDGQDDCGAVVPSGIYLYRLQTGNFTQVRKMILTH